MTVLRDPTIRLGARLRPGAGGLLAWWERSLVAWLPAHWRSALRLDPDRLLLVEDGGGVQLRLAASDGVRDLGRIPHDHDAGFEHDPLPLLLQDAAADLPRWLLLPASVALRRRLSLPAAAFERLRDVVSFEIDRQTPFTADAVAFDARVLGRRAGDGQLDVELVVVPDHLLQPRLAALGPIAAGLAGIDVADPQGAPMGVNLLAPERRGRSGEAWTLRHWTLLAIALVSLVAGLWQVLDNRREAAEGFAASVAALGPPARRAALQREALANAVAGQVFLDQMRAGRPAMIEVLDDLSRRIPDGTWLEKVSIQDDKLILIGLSSEASALVQRLEGSPLWRAPALTGALQQDPRSGRDRFTLMADLVTTAPKEPANAAPAR